MDVVEIRKQEGGKDCGLFAIAIATAFNIVWQRPVNAAVQPVRHEKSFIKML